MRLIKRYSNRKLYDTELRSYITLDGLAALILDGEEIRVLDNDTEEDLTSVILSQILLERERVQRFVPSAVLSQLLRSGENLGRNLTKVARPFVQPPPLPQFLEQEIERSLKFWLELGQNGEEETLRLLENLIDKRRHARNEGEAGPRRPRLSGGLDNFEEWGGAARLTLSPELLAAYLLAAREANKALKHYAESGNTTTVTEVESLQHKLNVTRARLDALLTEIARSK